MIKSIINKNEMISYQKAYNIIATFASQRGVCVLKYNDNVHKIEDDMYNNKYSLFVHHEVFVLVIDTLIVVGICYVNHHAYNHIKLIIKTRNAGYENILSTYITLKNAT